MNDQQPEALRLADLLDERPRDLMDFLPAKAAAELRRLNAECNDLAHQLNQNNERNGRIIAQRDALLEALQALYDEQEGPPLIRRHRQWQDAIDKARAAIKAAEEQK